MPERNSSPGRTRLLFLAVVWSVFLVPACPLATAQDDVSSPVPVVTALLEEHCFECHDEDTQEGGLRLDTLRWNLDDPSAFATWVKVHDKLSEGVMPPPADRDAPPVERYLAAADLALSDAIVKGEKPETQRARLSLLDQRLLRPDRIASVFRLVLINLSSRSPWL